MNDDLIQAYFNKALSSSQVAEFVQKLAAEPSFAEQFATASRLDSALRSPFQEMPKRKVFTKKFQKADAARLAEEATKARFRQRWQRLALGAAAIAVASGPVIWLGQHKSDVSPWLAEGKTTAPQKSAANVAVAATPAPFKQISATAEVKKLLRTFRNDNLTYRNTPITQVLTDFQNQFQAEFPETQIALSCQEDLVKKWGADPDSEPRVNLQIKGSSLLSCIELLAAEANLQSEIGEQKLTLVSGKTQLAKTASKPDAPWKQTLDTERVNRLMALQPSSAVVNGRKFSHFSFDTARGWKLQSSFRWRDTTTQTEELGRQQIKVLDLSRHPSNDTILVGSATANISQGVVVGALDFDGANVNLNTGSVDISGGSINTHEEVASREPLPQLLQAHGLAVTQTSSPDGQFVTLSGASAQWQTFNRMLSALEDASNASYQVTAWYLAGVPQMDDNLTPLAETDLRVDDASLQMGEPPLLDFFVHPQMATGSEQSEDVLYRKILSPTTPQPARRRPEMTILPQETAKQMRSEHAGPVVTLTSPWVSLQQAANLTSENPDQPGLAVTVTQHHGRTLSIGLSGQLSKNANQLFGNTVRLETSVDLKPGQQAMVVDPSTQGTWIVQVEGN